MIVSTVDSQFAIRSQIQQSSGTWFYVLRTHMEHLAEWRHGRIDLTICDGYRVRKPHDLPTLRQGADFGLFLGFAAKAFGKEFMKKRLFQFRGQRDQPLLLLDRSLHQPQYRRNLPLLGEMRNGNRETPKTCRANVTLTH